MTANIVEDLALPIRESFEKLLPALPTEVLENEHFLLLKKSISATVDPLAEVGTARLRASGFAENGLILPINIHLGYRNEAAVIKEDTFQYVPILSTIGMILNDQELYHVIIEENKTSCAETMRKFRDGSRFKNSQFCQVNTHGLQIGLYYDDLEVANPLGSRSGVHKLALFYFTLLNMPNHCNSHLENIHLVAVAHTSDVKKYGFNKITEVIAKDLKKLEDGVEFHLSHRRVTFKGCLVQFLGDNLAANGILGFQESFTANSFCRFCKMKKTETRLAIKQKREMLRTKQNFSSDFLASDPKSTGIKFNSALNSLNYFHVVESFSPDIMHDLLEGVCKFDALLLLKFLMKEKKVTLTSFNNIMNGFMYGNAEKQNKPVTIEAHHIESDNLRQNSSQMWCFITMMPMFVGHLMEEHCDVWQMFYLLREIMDLCFCPELTVEQSYYLESLVSEHHEMYLKLSSHGYLKPKMHFMTHYGEALRRNGPLINFWTMRHEGKNKVAKRVATVGGNFKNITKTVASRLQFKSYSDWSSGHNNGKPEMKHNIRLAELINIDETVQPILQPLLDAGMQIWTASACTVNGSIIKPGCIAIAKHLMACIKYIMCDATDEPLFIGKKLDVTYSCHYCGYKINGEASWCVIKLSALIYKKALYPVSNGLGQKFVIPKHFIPYSEIQQ